MTILLFVAALSAQADRTQVETAAMFEQVRENRNDMSGVGRIVSEHGIAAIEPLAAGLDDRHWWVRFAAVAGLSRLNEHEAAVRACVRAIADENDNVGRLAIKCVMRADAELVGDARDRALLSASGYAIRSSIGPCSGVRLIQRLGEPGDRSLLAPVRAHAFELQAPGSPEDEPRGRWLGLCTDSVLAHFGDDVALGRLRSALTVGDRRAEHHALGQIAFAVTPLAAPIFLQYVEDHWRPRRMPPRGRCGRESFGASMAQVAGLGLAKLLGETRFVLELDAREIESLVAKWRAREAGSQGR